MAFFMESVYKWQKDSWKRVTGTYSRYMLNTNRLSEIRAHSSGSSLYYIDNPWDNKNSGAYMVVNSTPAQLINNMNGSFAVNTMTVNVYLNNDPTQSTSELTLPCEYIAYAIMDKNSIFRTWITYAEAGGWDLKTILVSDLFSTIYGEAMGTV